MTFKGKTNVALCSVLLLLISCHLFSVQARLLKPAADQNRNSIEMEIAKVLNHLYVEAVKTGGPSHGGDGHAATHGLTLGGIKRSGPSPGAGN